MDKDLNYTSNINLHIKFTETKFQMSFKSNFASEHVSFSQWALTKTFYNTVWLILILSIEFLSKDKCVLLAPWILFFFWCCG